MKILAWGAAVSAVAALVACGGSGGGNSGGAGGGSGGGGTTTSTTTTTTTVSSTTSSSGSTGGGGAGPACGIVWEDPNDASRADCETCMEDACCSEMQACATGTPCDAWYQCAVACKGDGACFDACDTNNADGKADYDALSGCYDNSCKQDQACAYPVCMSGLALTSDYADCADCLTTSCCDQYTACMTDQNCGTCELSEPTKLPANCTDGSATAMMYDAAETCKTDSCGKSCTGDICGSGLGYQGFPSCNYCLTQQCCTEFDACQADATCSACLGAPTGPDCATNAALTAFTMCRDVTCKTDCGG